jgi:hypothetical protein
MLQVNSLELLLVLAALHACSCLTWCCAGQHKATLSAQAEDS